MSSRFDNPTAALDSFGFGKFQWLLLLYTGLAWFADACEVMLLSFLGPSVRCQWGVSAAGESLLTSVVFAGMLCGVYTLGAVADALGRRRGFLASAAVLGASGLASAAAPSFPWLLASRALVGVALGGTPSIVTMFAEFVPSAQRGRWLLLMQSFWTLGTMAEACLAWAVMPALGWRWLLALSATPLLLLLAFYPLLPESPHWLLVRGRVLEAEAVVARVAAVNGCGQQLQLDFAGTNSHGRGSSMERNSLVGPSGSSKSDNGVAIGLLEESESGTGFVQSGRPGGEASAGAAGIGSACHLERGVADAALAAWAHEPQAQALAGQRCIPMRRGRRHRLPAAAGTGGLLRQDGSGSSGSDRSGSSSEEEAEGEGRGWRGCMGGYVHGQQLQSIWSMRQAFRQLFGPRLLRSTLLLYVVWFVNALTYYGLVLLTTSLQTASEKESGLCTSDGKPNLTPSGYQVIFIGASAEAPGLLAVAGLVDWRGRRWALRCMLLCCACCAFALALAPGGRGWQLLLLFMARAGITGSYSVLYIYTSEVYPTAVRTFGLSLCNACSRVGGFLAPFATVYLVDQQDPQASELLLGALCLGAALAASLLPIETRGADLHCFDEAPKAPQVPGQHEQHEVQLGEGATRSPPGTAEAEGGGGKCRGPGQLTEHAPLLPSAHPRQSVQGTGVV